MISITSARGLTWPLNVLSGLQHGVLLLQRNPATRRNERIPINNIHNVRASHVGPRSIFCRKSVHSKISDGILANAELYTLKSKFFKYRIHCTNSGETMEKLSNSKIPISLVTRILQFEEEDKNKKPETKLSTTVAKLESTPPAALRVRRSEPSINCIPKVSSKAVVPYASNTSLRNVWRQSTPQRPKIEDLQKNSNFKETYEKLRRLGLLKARLGNCHVGMTSPSGKIKLPSENVRTPVRKAASKNVMTPKIPEIKTKFLQNNVVLKVQHYYNSQGKDLPDELKSLTRGNSNRNPAITNSFTDMKRRRYQVYPCTSPSSTYFTRTKKKGK